MSFWRKVFSLGPRGKGYNPLPPDFERPPKPTQSPFPRVKNEKDINITLVIRDERK